MYILKSQTFNVYPFVFFTHTHNIFLRVVNCLMLRLINKASKWCSCTYSLDKARKEDNPSQFEGPTINNVVEGVDIVCNLKVIYMMLHMWRSGNWSTMQQITLLSRIYGKNITRKGMCYIYVLIEDVSKYFGELHVINF